MIATCPLRCLGHRGSVRVILSKSATCESQVVESSGFDQLQSVYKRPCYSDRGSSQSTSKILKKSNNCPTSFSVKVAINDYNFDYIGIGRIETASPHPIHSIAQGAGRIRTTSCLKCRCAPLEASLTAASLLQIPWFRTRFATAHATD
jgi:hypothetical protein